MAPGTGPLGVLRRVRARQAEAGRALAHAAGEKPCELCAEPVEADHGHLVDLEGRGLFCACRACHLLFSSPGAGGHRYRSVPDRYVTVPTEGLSPAPWEALRVPVSVAYFFLNSTLQRLVELRKK